MTDMKFEMNLEDILCAFGIYLRESDGKYKGVQQVLEEIAVVWDMFDESGQQIVTMAITGKASNGSNNVAIDYIRFRNEVIYSPILEEEIVISNLLNSFIDSFRRV